VRTLSSIVIALALATGGVASAQVEVRDHRVVRPYPVDPPPPPAPENYAPRPGYVWVPGFHEWRNGAYVWRIGHWEQEQPGQRYVAARWVLQGDRYVLIPGRWEVAAVAYPTQPPPAPVVERWEPRRGYVWVPGFHEWRNGAYVWVGGHWEAERAGQQWVAGRWEPRGDRYVWVPGDWRTIVVPSAEQPAPMPPQPVVEYPREPPPPPRVERIVGRHKNHVWVRGHWDWVAGRWEWVPGHWEKEWRGKRWEEDRWERDGDHWVHRGGEWRE
jgi:hypothetical protein